MFFVANVLNAWENELNELDEIENELNELFELAEFGDPGCIFCIILFWVGMVLRANNWVFPCFSGCVLCVLVSCDWACLPIFRMSSFWFFYCSYFPFSGRCFISCILCCPQHRKYISDGRVLDSSFLRHSRYGSGSRMSNMSTCRRIWFFVV